MQLKCIAVLDEFKNMEPARLQPPAAGTKARAIQQAKDMQDLVAERAKRSGDEPPPYDFYELIGKGAYGRVFKGCVCLAHHHRSANLDIARIVLLAD